MEKKVRVLELAHEETKETSTYLRVTVATIGDIST
jgi:hypothetical protein